MAIFFEMYENITGENAYERPMRIYPAVHYTMGGLWVDYNLMSNVPGLHVLGEANFLRSWSQPARRLGAHAGPGRRILRHSLHHWKLPRDAVPSEAPDNNRSGVSADREGSPRPRAAPSQHQRDTQRGQFSSRTWPADVGQVRHGAGQEGPRGSHRADARSCAKEFWSNVKVLGAGETINQSLEKAGRVADFLEFGELMCRDALDRNESCGGHFRTEYQTPDGEALRDDENYAHVSAWKYEGEGSGTDSDQGTACL